MPAKTASERSLNASMAADFSWALTEDRSQRTQPARAALERKWLDMAGGDPVRAASFRRAHYKQMALRSAQARRKAKELTELAAEAEAELGALGGGPDAA